MDIETHTETLRTNDAQSVNMKLLLIAFAGLISLLSIASATNPHDEKNTKNKIADAIDYYEQQLHNLYTKCELNDKLEFTVFKQALAGYNSLEISNKKILSVIDFSKPSTEERLFIIDLENPKLLLQTLVAHGKNSGLMNAPRFSNRTGSRKSSLGFYITGNTYRGRHGYSLLLHGVEKGINDNARQRGVVIHGAKYVSKKYIDQNSHLGRSWGCPSVSRELSREIIDAIKGGSCLYIYSDDETYKKKSAFAEADLN